MHKIFLAVVCAATLAITGGLANAEDVIWEHDGSVTHDGITMGFDQSDNEISVGTDQVTLKNSDVVDLGIEYRIMWLETFPVAFSLDHEVDNDNILGLNIGHYYYGVGIDHELDFDIDNSDLDNTLRFNYALGNFDKSVEFDFDLDDSLYTGAEFNLGYNWHLSDRITLVPNVMVPWDGDGDRGTTKVGLSVRIDFDETPTVGTMGG